MPPIRRLEAPADHWLETSEGPAETLSLPLLGAIVMPGNVTFLNQFFEAKRDRRQRCPRRHRR